MNLHTTHCMGYEAITECRYNQPQSSVLVSYAVRACNSLFITHLPLSLKKKQRSWEKLQAPVLLLQIAAFGRNKAVAVLPWKPWRNLEPSGSSSGVYSLYPPTNSWLKTLRPTRGPGENPVLLRWPSTWGRHSEASIFESESCICRSERGSTIYLTTCQSWQNAQPWTSHSYSVCVH